MGNKFCLQYDEIDYNASAKAKTTVMINMYSKAGDRQWEGNHCSPSLPAQEQGSKRKTGNIKRCHFIHGITKLRELSARGIR